jgi:hypothetical protein
MVPPFGNLGGWLCGSSAWLQVLEFGSQREFTTVLIFWIKFEWPYRSKKLIEIMALTIYDNFSVNSR